MKHISVQDFKKIIERDAHNPAVDFINVCTTPEYNEKHIPGVRSVPLDELDAHLDEFKDKQTVYIHCRSGRRGTQAIERLQSLGVQAELVNVEGGILAWDQAGFPVRSVTSRMPIMRQVLLIAGLLVSFGVILSLLVHGAFVYLSLFVGLGLTFAGATGWCGMSYLLAKMPWNR